MAQVHKFLPDGGFVCGDTETGMTSYAYPTSVYATKARTRADDIAAEMLAHERRETRQVADGAEADFDQRNWRYLNAG